LFLGPRGLPSDGGENTGRREASLVPPAGSHPAAALWFRVLLPPPLASLPARVHLDLRCTRRRSALGTPWTPGGAELGVRKNRLLPATQGRSSPRARGGKVLQLLDGEARPRGPSSRCKGL